MLRIRYIRYKSKKGGSVMKKVTLICLLLLGVSSIVVGLSAPAMAKKVYPKVSTSKGLAPDLYLPDNPTPAVIKINEAKQAWFEERYPEACNLWREALNLKPRHPEGIWHDIGMCDMKVGNYKDAIQAYTKYMQMSGTKTATAYEERGFAYLENGDIANAEKDFFKSLSIDEKHADAYLGLFKIEENRSNFEKALFYIDKTIENAPKWTGGPTNKAYILNMLDRNQEARDLLLKSKMVKKDDYYYNLLGGIYERLKDNENAIKNYQKALDINPKHPYAETNICRIYMTLDKGEQAVQHCLKGIEIFPHWNGFFHLCHAFAVAKQYDRGLKVCQFLLANDVIHPDTYRYCAMNKAGLGDIAGAMEDIDKARIEINKWEPEQVAVGEAQYRLNKELKSLLELVQDIKNGKYSGK